MSAVAAASLLDIANHGQAKPSSQNAAEDFLALLSGHSGKKSQGGIDGLLASIDRDELPKQVAVEIEVPPSLFADTESRQDNEPNQNIQREGDNKQDASESQVKEKADAASARDEGRQPAAQPPARTDDSLKETREPAEDQAKTTSAAPLSEEITEETVEETLEPDDSLREKIEGQLDAIAQMLSAMLQSTGNNVPLGETAIEKANTILDAALEPASSVLTDTDASLQAQLQQLFKSQTASESSLATQTQALPTTAETETFENIQSILQQLHRLLQVSAQGGQQPLPAQSGETLESLAASLDAQMEKLAQFMQQPNAPKVLDAGTPEASRLKELLKTGIAQVKEQLKLLKSDNETLFAQIKAQFQAQISGLTDALNSNASVNKQTSEIVLPSISTVAVSAAAQDTQVQAPVNNNSQNGLALAAAASSTGQGDTSGSGSRDSGGQQQSMPQQVTGANASGQSSQTNAPSGLSFATKLEQANEQKLLDQVVFHMKTAVATGNSKIHIQLTPEDLGRLDIKLDVKADGKTTVTITADNRTTLDLLQKSMHDLARSLADAGLSTDSGSMNFNLSGRQPNEQGQSNPHAAMSYQKSQPEEDEELALDVITRSYVVNLAEGIDIKI